MQSMRAENKQDSPSRSGAPGRDVLGDVAQAFTTLGGAATAGAMVDGTMGTAIGSVLGGLLVLAIHLTKPSRDS